MPRLKGQFRVHFKRFSCSIPFKYNIYVRPIGLVLSNVFFLLLLLLIDFFRLPLPFSPPLPNFSHYSPFPHHSPFPFSFLLQISHSSPVKNLKKPHNNATQSTTYLITRVKGHFCKNKLFSEINNK